MATHEPVNIKALIFPGILAICAMIALIWFPPTISHQDAAINSTEMPEDNQMPAPTPSYETESGNMLENDLIPTLKTKEKTKQQNDAANMESTPV